MFCINRTLIKQRLLVEFSCELPTQYLILRDLLTVLSLDFVSSGCHNILNIRFFKVFDKRKPDIYLISKSGNVQYICIYNETNETHYNFILKSVSLLNALLDIKVGCFITSPFIKFKYLNEQTLMKDTICYDRDLKDVAWTRVKGMMSTIGCAEVVSVSASCSRSYSLTESSLFPLSCLMFLYSCMPCYLSAY